MDEAQQSSFPVLLVRHGESEWNVARLTQGQTNHPELTDRGRVQARAAGERLGAVLSQRDARAAAPRVQVWSSDLVRAQQTAAAVGEVLGVEVRPEPRLREQHLGTLQGRAYEDTWAAAEHHDWSDPTAPMAGGESVAQVFARMSEVLAEALVAARTGPVVLVSHGDAIRVGVGSLLGHGPGEGEWLEVPNGAVFEVAPNFCQQH